MIEHPVVSLPKALLLSIVSSAIGALVATCGFIAISAFVAKGSVGSTLMMAPLALLLVLPVSLVFAIPGGLIFGVPAIWTMQRAIVRWPVISTILLALLGCGLGYSIERYLDANSVQRGNGIPLYMAWGAVVGGLHSVTLSWSQRRSIGSTALAALGALIVVPVIALSVTHLVQNYSARRPWICDNFIFEVDHELAKRAYETVSSPGENTDRVTALVGDWARFDEGSSRAYSSSAIFFDGRRAITINDQAVLPQSIMTDLGFASRPEMRCLDRYAGPHRQLLRRIDRPIHLAHPEKDNF